MGEVYRALDRGTGQSIAIKVLHTQDGNHAARFEREARILADLDHPRIVRYVAHGALPSGDLYLAMEWLEGEDLAVRLARGRLSMIDSITLARFVAEVLGTVHDQGLVHRDPKPSNIFLVNGRIENVKLLDFGLALPEDATRMTSSEVMLGTVAYIAPEQARGERALDARVDIFALGCVLLECLTGEPAFAGSHALAILTKLLFEERPRLCDRLPGAPVELDALLARMLAKSPQERPRDGRTAAEALRTLDVTNLPDTGVGARLPDVAAGTIEQPRHRTGLTDSEQRAVAMILIGAPADVQTGVEPDSDARLAAEATAYGGRLERLIDGSAAVLLSGPKVATDLAAQAARCALTLGWHAPGRRLALAMRASKCATRAASSCCSPSVT